MSAAVEVRTVTSPGHGRGLVGEAVGVERHQEAHTGVGLPRQAFAVAGQLAGLPVGVGEVVEQLADAVGGHGLVDPRVWPSAMSASAAWTVVSWSWRRATTTSAGGGRSTSRPGWEGRGRPARRAAARAPSASQSAYLATSEGRPGRLIRGGPAPGAASQATTVALRWLVPTWATSSRRSQPGQVGTGFDRSWPSECRPGAGCGRRRVPRTPPSARRLRPITASRPAWRPSRVSLQSGRSPTREPAGQVGLDGQVARERAARLQFQGVVAPLRPAEGRTGRNVPCL